MAGLDDTLKDVGAPMSSLVWSFLTRVFWCCFGAGLLACPSSVNPVRLSVCQGQPVTLSCSGAASSAIDWRFRLHVHDQWQLVVELRNGGLSPGPLFDGRVKSVHVEKPGNYSLTLDPTEYNDGGVYECRVRNADHILSDVKLNVFVPSPVSGLLGEAVILPCYGNINKATGVNKLDIQWKKDGKMVYQHRNGNSTYGPGFENRVSLSLDRAYQGDLSLNITQMRLSDQGEYRCVYDSPEENGQPAAFHLRVPAIVPVDSSHSGWMVAAIVLGLLLCVALVYIWFKTVKRLKQERKSSAPNCVAKFLVGESQSDPPVGESQSDPLVGESQSDPPVGESQSDPPVEKSQSDPPVEESSLLKTRLLTVFDLLTTFSRLRKFLVGDSPSD